MATELPVVHSRGRRTKILLGLLSGGIDSAVAFAQERAKGEYSESHAIFLSWGQTALKKELDSFTRVCDILGVDVALRHVYKLGFEWCEPVGPSNERLFPVGRNFVFLAAACAAAATRFGGQRVTITVGFTADDRLADTSDDFLEKIRHVLQTTLGDRDPPTVIHVRAPLRRKTKSEGIQWAHSKGYEELLGITWSCYQGGSRPCGSCPACVIRAEAFRAAAIPDPASST